MTTLTKTTSVLDFAYRMGGRVRFARSVEDSEDGASLRAMDMATTDWEDLGRPEKITVTIEPGDTLNEG